MRLTPLTGLLLTVVASVAVADSVALPQGCIQKGERPVVTCKVADLQGRIFDADARVYADAAVEAAYKARAEAMRHCRRRNQEQPVVCEWMDHGDQFYSVQPVSGGYVPVINGL